MNGSKKSIKINNSVIYHRIVETDVPNWVKKKYARSNKQSGELNLTGKNYRYIIKISKSKPTYYRYKRTKINSSNTSSAKGIGFFGLLGKILFPFAKFKCPLCSHPSTTIIKKYLLYDFTKEEDFDRWNSQEQKKEHYTKMVAYGVFKIKRKCNRCENIFEYEQADKLK
jgi:hypothetical protein